MLSRLLSLYFLLFALLGVYTTINAQPGGESGETGESSESSGEDTTGSENDSGSEGEGSSGSEGESGSENSKNPNDCNYYGTGFSFGEISIDVAYPVDECFVDYSSNGEYSYYSYQCIENETDTIFVYSYDDEDCTINPMIIGNATGTTESSYFGIIVSVTAYCGGSSVGCSIMQTQYTTLGDECSSTEYDYYTVSGFVPGYCNAFGTGSIVFNCDDENDDDFTLYNFTETTDCSGLYTTISAEDETGIENCYSNGTSSYYVEINSDDCVSIYEPGTNTDNNNNNNGGSETTTTTTNTPDQQTTNNNPGTMNEMETTDERGNGGNDGNDSGNTMRFGYNCVVSICLVLFALIVKS